MSKRNFARNYTEESKKISTVLASPETKYAIWKRHLIEYTNLTLSANGIRPDYFINDIAARRCFESGMSPEQTFREQFRTS